MSRVASQGAAANAAQVDPPPDDPNVELVGAAGRLDAEHVAVLLAEGASAKFVHELPGTWGSASSKTALHAAIEARPQDMASTDGVGAWVATIKLLLDAKSDVNAKRREYDWRGCGTTRTAFEMVVPVAISMQDVSLIEAFLACGADPNTKAVRDVHSMRTNGRSVRYVLHEAVQSNNLEVTRALIDRGAHVDAYSSEHFDNERGFNRHMDEMALHIACAAGCLAMVALLLAGGADVDAVRRDLEQEKTGVESPTDDPRDPEFEASVRCVPVEERAVHIAVLRGNAKLLVMLLCAGADCSSPRVRGESTTPIEELCGENQELLQALKTQWTPQSGALLPAEVRESTEEALAIAQRQGWQLPDLPLFSMCLPLSSPKVADADPPRADDGVYNYKRMVSVPGPGEGD